MQQPLVSIIIPTYNRAVRIIQTLDSVLEQTYPNLEVIVVDDGSTDNTLQILNDYSEKAAQKQITLKIIAQKNAGAPAARNNGLRNANGESVVFFDSDDIMLPERIETQIKIMLEENSDCCACGFFIKKEKNIQRIYLPYIFNKKGELYSFLRNRLLGSTQSWMFKKILIMQVGGYDESLTCWQDSDITFRVLVQQPIVSIIKQPLSVFNDYHDENRIMKKMKNDQPTYNSIVKTITKRIDYCSGSKDYRLFLFAMNAYWTMIAYIRPTSKYSNFWREFTNIVKVCRNYSFIYRVYAYVLSFYYVHYCYFKCLLKKILRVRVYIQ